MGTKSSTLKFHLAQKEVGAIKGQKPHTEGTTVSFTPDGVPS
jgi:hypothetical protein